MRLKWHAKWQNPVRKGVRSGLPARSSTLTPRGEAISMSFGFDRLAPPPRCERLENEPHFLRFRALTRRKPPQTLSSSFMSPSPSRAEAHMKKGYWIVHVDVTDPENYPRYLAADAIAFEKFDANFLVRGGDMTGPESFKGGFRRFHIL
ncbi:MAG: DUF1330 domain-containing protein, partial [Pseudomonadota bacterium]